VSKSIGEMFVAMKGEVDAILLTGDLAYSDFVVNYIRDHVSKLGQVIVYAGDNEIQAMAANAYRVIKGEIEVAEYK
jgi:butyrate kinase